MALAEFSADDLAKEIRFNTLLPPLNWRQRRRRTTPGENVEISSIHTRADVVLGTLLQRSQDDRLRENARPLEVFKQEEDIC